MLINYNLLVDREKIFNVISKTNINGELAKPIITFKLLEGDNLSITNMRNGETLELNQLNVGDTYVIYNRQRQMINLTNIIIVYYLIIDSIKNFFKFINLEFIHS